GHRQGDEARDEHAHGSVRTRGLHRPGHRPRRDGGPLPRDGGPKVPTVDAPAEVRARGPPRTKGGPRRVRIHEGLSVREAIRAAPARSAVAAAGPIWAVAP